MPCCAAAVFVLSQIWLGYSALRRLFFGAAVESAGAARNDVVAWGLFGSVPAPAPPARLARAPRFSPRAIALAAALEIILAIGAVYGVSARTGAGNASSASSAFFSICKSPRLFANR